MFLLSAVYPFAIYLGIRDRNPGALALGLLTGVLALLAHPVSALLVGGLGGWIMVIHLKRDQLTPLSLWKQRNARWLALGVVVLAGAVVAWYLPVLRSRVLAHGGGRPTEHFLFFPGRQGIKQIGLLLSYAEGLTLPAGVDRRARDLPAVAGKRPLAGAPVDDGPLPVVPALEDSVAGGARAHPKRYCRHILR